MNSEARRFRSVWDAIEETPELAARMRNRSALMIALAEHIRAHSWTTAQAAGKIGVPEAQVVALMEGRIDALDEGLLQSMLDAFGLRLN